MHVVLPCALSARRVHRPAVKAAGGAGVPKLARPELSQVVVHSETVKFASMFLCGGTAIGAVVMMLGRYFRIPPLPPPSLAPLVTLTPTAAI